MGVMWEAVPHRTNRVDVFADTNEGRYLVRRTTVARQPVYVLRLNNKEVGRYESATEAKSFVEQKVGSNGR